MIRVYSARINLSGGHVSCGLDLKKTTSIYIYRHAPAPTSVFGRLGPRPSTDLQMDRWIDKIDRS